MFANKWQLVSFVLGVFFLVLLVIFIAVYGFDYPALILATFSGTSFFFNYAAKQSEKFKQANALTGLIQRDGAQLVLYNKHISPSYLSPKVTLDIARISVITIRDSYIGVIVDDNGNGYDFQLLGSTEEIKERIMSLLSEQEFARIKLN